MSIRSLMRHKARSVDIHADLTLYNNAKHITQYSATPNAVITMPLGSLCWDYGGEDIYINTDGASAWSKIVD